MQIIDEFTDLPISRQRKYQLRKHRDGLCVECGKKAVTPYYCEQHRRITNVYSRERQRAVLGCKRRNNSAESYGF